MTGTSVESTAMRASPVARLAWLPAAAFLLFVGAGLMLQALRGVSDPIEDVVAFATFGSFPAVGGLIASRRPKNPIGWLFAVVGLGSGLSFFLEELARYGGRTGSDVAPWLVWASSWVWVTVPALLFVLLLFPNGRLPSRRWRPVAVLLGAHLCALALAFALNPGSMEGSDDVAAIANPIGVESLGPLIRGFFGIAFHVLGVFGLLGAVSVVARFRGSRGEERQQLKWFAYAAVVAGLGLATIEFVPPPYGDIPFLASFLALPTGAAIAILRYRLYDIDRIINRTLVYGLLTAVLVGTYLGAVIGLGAAVRGLAGQDSNSVVVAMSTLLAAGVFRPARARIQGLINRRFYRSTYDAARTLDAFAARLRNEVELDALSDDVLGAVRQTVQPAHASLWLRAGKAAR